jgi:2-oxoglutarate dehydrogenase E1 component
MSRGLSELASSNLNFVEELYAQYLDDPDAVPGEWREAFADMDRDAAADGSGGNGAAPAGRSDVRIGPAFLPHSIFNPPGDGANGHAAERPEAPLPPPTRIDAGTSQARLGFLRSLTLFRDLKSEELEAVARVAEEVELAPGDIFVREGEVGSDLFVVTSGRVEVRQQGRSIAKLGAGEVVGEMSVFDRQPRSADLVADGPTKVLRLRGDALLELIDKRSQLAQSFIRILTRRLRESSSRQDRVDQLIRAYRVRGHLMADLDPLGATKEIYPELNPAYYGFGQEDLDTTFSSNTIPGSATMRLRDILDHLRNTYCRSIGVQFMHIDDIRLKMWLQDKMETTQNTRQLSSDEQVRILTKLTDAEIFEQFIHKKFVGAKRFSLEGAESLIPLLDMAIEDAGARGMDEIVIGMAHRGRLNVLANILGKSARQIFREFDDSDPDRLRGRGDVKYHLGYSSDRLTASGHKVHLSLTFNPSHLEFVDPVVSGRVRAKQDRYHDLDRTRGMGILIHGDASFAGQGIVQESLNMMALDGYKTGGTLHIVVNNQIGFTTSPGEGRSTQYATDVAKMLQIPIIHVNGEHPEAVAQAIYLALEFRAEFHSDVVIDMYCYRRYGHNEGDEPAFTQPALYKLIRKRKSVREGYLDNLYNLGQITPEQADQIAIERREALESALGEARSENSDAQTIDLMTGQGFWKPYRGGRDVDAPEAETKVDRSKLVRLLESLNHLPHGFTPHSKFKRFFSQRDEMIRGEKPLDWAAGEALAFATLLDEGRHIRLTGQDSERGTFSHRHAVLHDVETGGHYIPLRNLSPNQGRFEVRNSPLSEAGVLGFEYGYSLDYPEALVLWEAQFGDFINGAQVIVDQFVTSGEDKWSRLTGLVLLLPHGFEGQGPEHSSARLERFLVAAAEDNVQVCNLTTPAQLFHCLRRQVVRPYRKPLVIMSPKSLLRHPRAVSELEALSEGTFQRIIPDTRPSVDPSGVRRVILTSGKVYFELEERREELNADDVALIRVEQYYPMTADRLMKALEPYPEGTEVVWVQEEPWNMGAWFFLRMRYGEHIERRHPFWAITRPASASPATGSAAAHKVEQEQILERAFASESGTKG